MICNHLFSPGPSVVHFMVSLTEYFLFPLFSDLIPAMSSNVFQVISCLTPDPMKQEPLLVENVPDPLAGEQV